MKVTEGRIVLYRYAEHDEVKPHVAGETRPAIVVRVWPNEFGPGIDGVNLEVFTDGSNDFSETGTPAPRTYWATSRAEGTEPGQWSWPPRVA